MSKLCKDCACENVCGITHLPEHEACEFYKAETVTEIEKIKEEIGEMYDKFEKDNLYFAEGLEMAYNIIEKHISELKGENE